MKRKLPANLRLYLDDLDVTRRFKYQFNKIATQLRLVLRKEAVEAVKAAEFVKLAELFKEDANLISRFFPGYTNFFNLPSLNHNHGAFTKEAQSPTDESVLTDPNRTFPVKPKSVREFLFPFGPRTATPTQPSAQSLPKPTGSASKQPPNQGSSGQATAVQPSTKPVDPTKLLGDRPPPVMVAAPNRPDGTSGSDAGFPARPESVTQFLFPFWPSEPVPSSPSAPTGLRSTLDAEPPAFLQNSVRVRFRSLAPEIYGGSIEEAKKALDKVPVGRAQLLATTLGVSFAEPEVAISRVNQAYTSGQISAEDRAYLLSDIALRAARQRGVTPKEVFQPVPPPKYSAEEITQRRTDLLENALGLKSMGTPDAIRTVNEAFANNYITEEDRLTLINRVAPVLGRELREMQRRQQQQSATQSQPPASPNPSVAQNQASQTATQRPPSPQEQKPVSPHPPAQAPSPQTTPSTTQPTPPQATVPPQPSEPSPTPEVASTQQPPVAQQAPTPTQQPPAAQQAPTPTQQPPAAPPTQEQAQQQSAPAQAQQDVVPVEQEVDDTRLGDLINNGALKLSGGGTAVYDFFSKNYNQLRVAVDSGDLATVEKVMPSLARGLKLYANNFNDFNKDNPEDVEAVSALLSFHSYDSYVRSTGDPTPEGYQRFVEDNIRKATGDEIITTDDFARAYDNFKQEVAQRGGEVTESQDMISQFAEWFMDPNTPALPKLALLIGIPLALAGLVSTFTSEDKGTSVLLTLLGFGVSAFGLMGSGLLGGLFGGGEKKT